MAQMLVIPTKQTIEAWENNNVTDEQLAIMLEFLEYMFLGCDAMGEKYESVTVDFWREFIRALGMTNARKAIKANESTQEQV